MSKLCINIQNSDDINTFYNRLRLYKLFCSRKTIELNIPDTINEEDRNDLLMIEEAFNIKDKYKRLEYVYYKVCEILDKPIKENICDFDKNGLCAAQRAGKHPSKINGCCGTCKYISKNGCTICSLSCKTFYCSYIIKLKHIPSFRKIKLYKYFFSLPQKMIIETNFWNTAEENLKLLSKTNFISWLFYRNKKMKRF